MPGTEGDAPDALDDLIAQTADDGSSQNGQEATMRALQPQENGAAGQEGKPRLIFGKYKDLAAAEVGHKSLRSELDKRGSKIKSYESILSNPKLHALAAQDPEVREALAKIGFNLAEAETEEYAKSVGAQEESEGFDPRASYEELQREVGVMKASMSLKEEMLDFQDTLGRKLTSEEKREIFGIIKDNANLPIQQAWKLTSAYEKSIREREEKAAQGAAGRSRIPRPRPPSPLTPGQQQIQSGKDVTKMSRSEAENYLQEILAKNG